MDTNLLDPEKLARDLYDANPQAFEDEVPFHLERHERDSALWLKIHNNLVIKLVGLRISNDSTLTALETERLRGRIEAVKEFLDMGKVPRLEEHSDTPDPGY